jgi:hypothetical protein
MIYANAELNEINTATANDLSFELWNAMGGDDEGG